MEKIKAFIIHWLGGVTEQECKDSSLNSYDRGYINALYRVKLLADSRYGRDWRGELYQHICDRITQMKGGSNDNT